MEGILKFLLLFYCLTVFYKSTTYCYEDLSSPIITLPEGKIRGLYKTNFYNETTLAFYSVPYGTPPVGELRFKLKMDTSILAPVAATAVNHFRAARNVPLYAFRIDVETKRNFFKAQKHLEQVPGTADADSIGFLWDAQELPRPNPGTIEALTVYRFVKLWTNFAIYGNPTPNKDLGVIWPPIDNDQAFKVLEIGEKLQILGDLPERDRLQVWREIYKQSQYTANYL